MLIDTKNCALIDFNNLAFRLLFTKDVGLNLVPNPDFQLWKYFVFENIYDFIVRFKKIDEVVIAVDDTNSWRKSFFPRYKESRKKNREKQELVNWSEVFELMHNYVGELKHHLPFKVIKVRNAEADDVIGIIANNTDNECIIYSNDEDYLQLSSSRVELYNPTKHEIVECEHPRKFIIEKCLMGQSKDDIFNVMTPDNWGQTEGTEGKRKPGFGPKAVEKVFATGDYVKWIKSQKIFEKFDVEVDVEKNFKRNLVLMSFDKIPNIITKRVMESYLNYNFPPPRNIIQYFKKNKMRRFIQEYHYTENRLMRLY